MIAPIPLPQRANRILFIDAYDSFSNNIVSLLHTAIPDTTVSVIKIDDPRFFSRPESALKPTTSRLCNSGPRTNLSVSDQPSQCRTPPNESLSNLGLTLVGRDRDSGGNPSDGIDYAAFYSFLSTFDAVVAGPGPGHPSVPTDVGVVPALWQQDPQRAVPVLGICLGFQSLAQHAGLRVVKLSEARHGLVVPIDHNAVDDHLFAGIPADGCVVTVYHSLGVQFGPNDRVNRAQVPALENAGPDQLSFWDAGTSFLPLAWDSTSTDNGPVLMGLKYRHGPFWGVQYHPESVCTNSSGKAVIQNWWTMARECNKQGDRISLLRDDLDCEMVDVDDALPSTPRSDTVPLSPVDGFERVPGLSYSPVVQYHTFPLGPLSVPDLIRTLRLPAGNAEAVVLQSARKASSTTTGTPTSRRDGRDRFSVLGVVDPMSLRFYYSVRTGRLEIRLGPEKVVHSAPVADIWAYLSDFMQAFSLPGQAVVGGSPGMPFWGGLMGFISYEAGLETLGITPTSGGDSDAADVLFVFVHQSVVVDHYSGSVTVQSILPNDEGWVEKISRRIQVVGANVLGEVGPDVDIMKADPEESIFTTWIPSQALVDSAGNVILPAVGGDGGFGTAPPSGSAVKSLPDADDYRHQIRACQELIQEGESYELCLTGQIGVTIPVDVAFSAETTGCSDEGLVECALSSGLAAARRASDWSLYSYSCQINPAPYSAFIRLDRSSPSSPSRLAVGAYGSGVSIVSCSPEKFLSWSRDGKCQMRPIKGTLGKWDWTRLSEVLTCEEMSTAPEWGAISSGGSSPAETKIPFSLAELYFERNIKERAENLMIVDLIRHDLHGVAAGPVEVPGCMVVEEYDAVYQLVSVIEADLNADAVSKGTNGLVSPVESPISLPILAIPSPDSPSSSSPSSTPPTGLSVLSAALPPGSMTGAPKLRSCQLLSHIESGDRGIYSGVLGYLDVGGAGHFNVVIRTGVRWDWECTTTTVTTSVAAGVEGVDNGGEGVDNGGESRIVRVVDTWHVGAGGAITAKSDPDDEVDEMMIKARSTLRMFGIVV